MTIHELDRPSDIRFKDLQEKVERIPHAPTRVILSAIVTGFPNVSEFCKIPPEPVAISKQVDILSKVLQREISQTNMRKLLESNIVRNTSTGIKTFDGYTAKQNAVGYNPSQLLVVAAILNASIDMETAWKKLPYEIVAVETARRLGFGTLSHELTNSFESYRGEFDLEAIRKEIDIIADEDNKKLKEDCLDRMEQSPSLIFLQGTLPGVLVEDPDEATTRRVISIINRNREIPYKEIDMGTRSIKIFLPRDVLAFIKYFTVQAS